MKRSEIFLIVGILVVLSPRLARGDGGTLRAWKQGEIYDVAVFTDPTPLVAGPVDVSVLLLDRETGEPVPDARIVVDVSPAGHPEPVRHHPATHRDATNKLLYAALFAMPGPGPCRVVVDVEGPKGRAEVPMELDVGRAWTPQAGIWPWILWPVPIILIYGVRFGRRSRNES